MNLSADHRATPPWRAGSGTAAIAEATVLAASPHNSQPWILEIGPGWIDVLADETRWLGTPDPYRRELYTGLGCALENLVIAARAHGYAPAVTLLPDNRDPATAAHVDLTPAARHVSLLFDAIGDRHTNRGPYQPRSVPHHVLSHLSDVATPADRPRVMWVTAEPGRGELGTMMVEAAAAVTGDDEQSRDNFAWSRRTHRGLHRVHAADGLDVTEQGLSANATTLAGLAPSSRAAIDRCWVRQTRLVHTRTAAAYGLLLVPDAMRRTHQIAGGRLLERVHLAATARGVALHHMNQITERIDRDRSLGQPSQFGPRIEALIDRPAGHVLAIFRVGYPERPGTPSPRRPTADVVR